MQKFCAEPNIQLADFHFDNCNANQLVKITSGLFRTNYEGKLESTKDLETLIYLSSKFVCSNPRDTIYALWNLASDVLWDDESRFVPNYHRDTLEIYGEFILEVAHNSESLDILCRRWAIPDPNIKLPSWIGLANHAASAKPGQSIWNGQTPISFVGSPGEPLYNACGVSSNHRIPDIQFSVYRRSEDKDGNLYDDKDKDMYGGKLSLQVRGGIIDRVADVKPISRIQSWECFEILGGHSQERRI